MNDIMTKIAGLSLVAPDTERDAPFALDWFTSDFGTETLLSMGNPEAKIKPSTIESEKAIIDQFVKLEKAKKQLTWMIRYRNKTIGAGWIELVDSEAVRSPSIHIMIGDKNLRGRGIGKSITKALIEYADHSLGAPPIYSRHLVSNKPAEALLKSLGFTNDGDSYIDGDRLEWQNLHLMVVS
ncbi:MAG: GNAT family N-acetyltransferase [Candidatus Saccharibacteria bacterium]